MTSKRDFGLRWCFSTLGCPSVTLESVCDLANAFGVPLIELRFLENEVDLPKYFDARFQSGAEAAEILRRAGVRIASLDSSFRLIGSDEAALGDLLRFVDWAEALAVPRIRVFDGGPKGAPFTTALREEAYSTWSWWKALREKKGWKVDLMIETHDVLASASAVGFWAERSGIQSDLLWDSYHTWAVGGNAPEFFWAEHHPRIAHVHLKDGLGQGPDGKAQYTLFGQGRFPFEPLLETLQAEGYRGPVSVEWERKWHPELPSLEDCLRSLKRLGWM